MRTLTKILPLFFLFAAPMTVLAMDGDNIPESRNKRPLDKSEREPEVRKRQRTQAQEIIDTLDQKEPDEKYREIHKGSEKYKKIDEFENHLGSLKKLTPEFIKLFLGNDPERRLGMMEDVLEQLKKRYYRDFFAKPTSLDYNSTSYLSDELKHLILSYCSTHDLANLLLVSHEVRDAVYSLMPVFKEVVECGQYKDMDKFLRDFHDGSPCAHAAIGIAQYQSPNRETYYYQRNKWLDLAFNECDLSAVFFVFQNRLFTNADGDKDNVYENLEIIREVYEKQDVGKDLLLDKGVANYLAHLIEERKSKKEVLSVVEILTTTLAGSIEANLILYDAYLTGIVTKSKKKIIVLPKDTDKADKYFSKANEIANTLPSFERGMAHFEIGFWQLIKASGNRKIQATDPSLKIINLQWERAIDAWTEAEEGNRQKAVAHFKENIMKSSLFSWASRSSKFSSFNSTFLSTTEQYGGSLIENEYIAFWFLSILYEKDKKISDSLEPYHKDINMALVAARNAADITSRYSRQYSETELKIASNYYIHAIRESLPDCNEELRDKLTNELNAIPQGKLSPLEQFEAYERILKQLGLGDPSIMLSPVE
ncbi:F-box protein [Candidatus Paracaedibacter symbiosus]|uniref:F-box protein n=1 Tax=Candidatus Paracaedibacter symbiosus TaxID=244582 RepID=UPI0005093FF3|nr:F-box protein [Candidatus Paracaedibacter symbiosus]